MDVRPVFYYDFASPEAYLAAEQAVSVLPGVTEWQPVRLLELTPNGIDIRIKTQARVEELEMQELRWPEPFPPENDLSLLAATYAKKIGRVVAFSLAAFRQAYAGGRDLGQLENILIAAAACELHPAAVCKGIDLKSVESDLDQTTNQARSVGVSNRPAVSVGDRLFVGEQQLEAAAAYWRSD